LTTYLPENRDIDVPSLARVFNDTTNSYKFYWFLAILDSLETSNGGRLLKADLSLKMVANVWYPLNYYKLSFGVQDQFSAVAQFISGHLTVNTYL
jgi:hypothetical protein